MSASDRLAASRICLPAGKVATALLILFLASPVAAEDWPQFRGTNRDGISPEKGLLDKWPEGGPKLLWRCDALGAGYSSAAVVGDRIYTAGTKGGQAVVFALDTGGEVLWEKPIGRTGGGGYAGPRSTPTVEGDRLWVLGDDGDLACLSTGDGEVVWSKNVLREYGAGNITWRLAESPLIDGDRVICQPGGKASMVALDKATGKEVWAAAPVDPLTGYSSAVVVETKRLRQIVGHSASHVFGVRAEDGELLWTAPQENRHKVNATSVVSDDGIVFSSCGYGQGSQALRLAVSGGKARVEQAWTNRDLDDHFGGVVLLKGVVYGTPSRGSLMALKLGNGAVGFRSREVGKSSIIYADGKLYCQNHHGPVQLVNPANGGVISSFTETPAVPKQLWAHPAIADGVLYIRNGGTLKAFAIK